jgi:hypothetical protein
MHGQFADFAGHDQALDPFLFETADHPSEPSYARPIKAIDLIDQSGIRFMANADTHDRNPELPGFLCEKKRKAAAAGQQTNGGLIPHP